MKMGKTFITKIAAILLSLVCLTSVFVPAMALEEDVKQTEVLFVCKVAKEIKTDEYAPVVVQMLNEDTGKTYNYKLYQYNNFTERYLMNDGHYSIIQAYIPGRSDIIFKVKADDTFKIGYTKTVYFELGADMVLGEKETKTTKPVTTTRKVVPSTTENTELHTLFPVLTTNENTTGEDDTEGNESTTANTDDTTGVTEPYVTEPQGSDPSVTNKTETTTCSSSVEDIIEMRDKISKFFIILFILIILAITAFGVIYTKKNKE